MDKKLMKNVLLDERTRKGIKLYQNNCVSNIGLNKWQIKNQDKKYTIQYSDKNWSCTCPDHKYRHHNCKHIHAAQLKCKYTTKTAPPLTLEEMKTLDQELQQQIHPRPHSLIEEKIHKMKTIVIGLS